MSSSADMYAAPAYVLLLDTLVPTLAPPKPRAPNRFLATPRS